MSISTEVKTEILEIVNTLYRQSYDVVSGADKCRQEILISLDDQTISSDKLETCIRELFEFHNTIYKTGAKLSFYNSAAYQSLGYLKVLKLVYDLYSNGIQERSQLEPLVDYLIDEFRSFSHGSYDASDNIQRWLKSDSLKNLDYSTEDLKKDLVKVIEQAELKQADIPEEGKPEDTSMPRTYLEAVKNVHIQVLGMECFKLTS